MSIDRDTLWRVVRFAWLEWAKEQPNPKPSWLIPYDELSESDKEADRRIGEVMEDFLSRPLVCVLCGNPWLPGVKNRCECGGLCSWGPTKGADPSSWERTETGGWRPRPVPKDVVNG